MLLTRLEQGNSNMVLVLREGDVRRVLKMPDVVDVLDLAFKQLGAGEAVNHPRVRLVLPEMQGVLHALIAAAPRLGVLGYKTYTAFREGVRFLVMLYSSEDGRLLAQIEADWLGRMRTGGMSGLATRYMARPEANFVGIIGTGDQARTQLMGLCAVRTIRTVRVYGRDIAKREAYCQEMQMLLGVEVLPVATPEEAVREAEIIVTATTARHPILAGMWLLAGTHVNAMGSNWANRREIDDEAVQRSDIVAVDALDQAHLEAGDLLIPAAAGHFDFAHVVPLASIVSGQASGRNTPEEITLFKSLGLAIEDIAVAKHVYELARQEGLGEDLSFLP
jgi:ornithine cyclodeaminase/alanine dehydrogenase-like protein (mu-crystallin family)